MWGLTPEFCKNIPTKKSNRVVFTLTSYEADKKHDQKMIDVLNHCYDELYYWPQSLSDVDYIKQFDRIEKVTIVAPNLIAYDKVLSENIDYVGNRLHGGIYAMQHYCRAIIIAIDYRAKEMAASYSFKCIDRNNMDKLESIIESGWNTEITGLDLKKIDRWKRQFK